MNIAHRAALAAVFSLAVSSLSPIQDANAATQCGKASWYDLTSITASGVRHNPAAMTAAHRSLPFGTKVKVKNLSNGRSLVVRIIDRGPFIAGRIIDLSKGAASRLGFQNKGVTKVCLSKLQG